MFGAQTELTAVQGRSSAQHERIGDWCTGRLNPNALCLSNLIERVGTVLPAVAAVATATERAAKGHGPVHVDPYRAGIERLGHPMCSAKIPRPHPGGKTVFAVVRNLDGFLFVAEADHGEDRPEKLVAGNVHVVGHVVQDRGFVKPTAASWRTLATGAELGSCPQGFSDPLLHPFENPELTERAHLGLVLARVAKDDCFCPTAHDINELIGDPLLAQEPRARNTRL